MKLNTEINCIIGSEYEHLYKWQYPSLEERASSEKVNGACSNVSLFLENELLELIEQCQYASQTESPPELSDECKDEHPLSPEWVAWD